MARTVATRRTGRRAPTVKRRTHAARQQVSSGESERLLRDFFENANDACALFSLDGYIWAVNGAAERLVGRTRQELRGAHVRTVATEQTVAETTLRSQQFLAGHKPASSLFMAELLHRDGRIIETEARTRAVRNARGQVIGYQGIFRDLTERRRMEAALREAERRYRTLVERVPAVIYIADRDGHAQTRYINPRIHQLLGFTPDDWLADPELWQQQVHPDDRERVFATIRRSLADNTPFRADYRLRARDGRVVWVHDEVVMAADRDAQGTPTSVIGVMLDVTEQKQAEEQRQHSETRYRSLFDASPDLMYLTDTTGRLLDANARVLRGTGLAIEALREKTVLDFFAGSNRKALLSHFAKLTRGERVPPIEVDATTGNGQVQTLEVHAVPLTDAQGQVREILSVARDMTARKAAEQALQENEALRLRITEALPDLVYVYRLDPPQLRWVNHHLTTLLGYAPDRLQHATGPLFDDLVHPDDVIVMARRLRDLVAVDAPLPLETECRVRHGNGEYRWLRLRETVCTRSPEGTPSEILGTAQDITSRKRVTQALQTAAVAYADVGPRLQAFRDRLGMTQEEFGHHFGDYNQKQISSYERGRVEVPLQLLLNINAKGYPLETILGTSSTTVLEETLGYLTASHRDHVLIRQLVETLLSLLERNELSMTRVLHEFERTPAPLTGGENRFLSQLIALTKSST